MPLESRVDHLKKLLAIVNLVILTSCQGGSGESSPTTDLHGGRCLLSKGFDEFLCIQFQADYNSVVANDTCSNMYKHYYSTSGANAVSWLSGNSNECNTTSTVGHCNRSDGTAYYYSVSWTAGAALMDCTNEESGTFSP